MFRTFFINGHQLADLDPLKLVRSREFGQIEVDTPDFTLEGFGFKKEELTIPLYFGNEEQRAFIYPFMVEKEEWTI